jgi:ribose 5-phosphate isomerase B
MKIAIGADHGGYPLNERVIEELRAAGHEIEDFGTHDGTRPDDYPDYAVMVGEAVRDGRADCGIIICGSGVGACVAANKLRGVRAALCGDTYSAHQSREHDDCNVLCLGARIVGVELASRSCAPSSMRASQAKSDTGAGWKKSTTSSAAKPRRTPHNFSKDDLERAGDDAKFQRRQSAHVAIGFDGKRIGGHQMLDADAHSAMDTNARIDDVAAAMNARHLAHERAARQAAGRHDIEASVIDARIRRKHHAAARERAVGNGDQIRRTLKCRLVVHAYRDAPRAPTHERGQRRERKTRFTRQAAH